MLSCEVVLTPLIVVHCCAHLLQLCKCLCSSRLGGAQLLLCLLKHSVQFLLLQHPRRDKGAWARGQGVVAMMLYTSWQVLGGGGGIVTSTLACSSVQRVAELCCASWAAASSFLTAAISAAARAAAS